MTFIDGARFTKRRNGAGWCALLSKQISLLDYLTELCFSLIVLVIFLHVMRLLLPDVRLSVCLPGTGVHCDHTVHCSADLS